MATEPLSCLLTLLKTQKGIQIEIFFAQFCLKQGLKDLMTNFTKFVFSTTFHSRDMTIYIFPWLLSRTPTA